jgi:hypothetical protein
VIADHQQVGARLTYLREHSVSDVPSADGDREFRDPLPAEDREHAGL